MAMAHRDTGNGIPFTVRLGNADFEVMRESRKIADLKLDGRNPRLGYLLSRNKKGGAASDEDLHKMLWDIDQVKALYQSVYQNGGLLEDPVVHADGTVVEGNCRTVVMRELAKKYPKDERFQELYVRVLPENVTDEQISLLLGELHIAGKIEWRAFDQAEYVWRMHKVYGKTYDFLATHLRWSRAKLAQKIGAYEETKAYLDRTGDEQGINRFSHFEEFMKKKPLRDRRNEDPDFMIRFGEWVQEGKLPDAKDLRQLPAVLESKEAMQALEKKGMRAAREILQKSNPSMVSNLYGALDQTCVELESISLQEITALQNGDRPRIEKFQRLTKALERVQQIAGVNFSS